MPQMLQFGLREPVRKVLPSEALGERTPSEGDSAVTRIYSPASPQSRRVCIGARIIGCVLEVWPQTSRPWSRSINI
jgi:hypothetical protein